MHARNEGGGQGAQWPYAVALVGMAVGALGLGYAPISGIVYFISLPALLPVSVWLLRQRYAPGRSALLSSAALMLAGFLAGIFLVWRGRVSPFEDPSLWLEAMLLGALVIAPAGSILLGIAGAAYGLGAQQRSGRGGSAAYSSPGPTVSNEPVR